MNAKFGIRNSEFGIKRLETGNWECGVRDSELKNWKLRIKKDRKDEDRNDGRMEDWKGAEVGMANSEFRIKKTGRLIEVGRELL